MFSMKTQQDEIELLDPKIEKQVTDPYDCDALRDAQAALKD